MAYTEYISDELTNILNISMLYSTNTIYEEYHVVKQIEKCTSELTEFLLDKFKTMSLDDKKKGIIFASDWYIKSHIDPD